MLQIQPNRWSCSVTSFAMALEVPVQQLIDEIGHDGSTIAFSGLPEPSCRRGFHSQELVKAALMHGFTCTPVELFPVICPKQEHCENSVTVIYGNTIESNWERFRSIINNTIGVLEGQGERCNHAVHYRYGVLWDPGGEIYEYSPGACESRGFFGKRLWIINRINK